MEPIIQVQDLNKTYGSRGVVCKALNHLNFEIEKGKFLAIMGPSGSGKTTLLNMLSSIDVPTSGKIFIEGKEIGTLNERQLSNFRAEKMGFVFQEFNLLDNMTVQDNIALPLTLNNEKVEVILERVKNLAQLLGIENQLNKYPYELSGGQKQRAAICRALIRLPKILFADEPTGALDSRATTELLQCFKDVKKVYGTTIVMVTHDAGAASYADEVIFLRDGYLGGKVESNHERKSFFKQILQMIDVLGGDSHANL